MNSKSPIVILASRYPTPYNSNSYIFVKDQVDLISQNIRPVFVVGCITISLKDIFRKGLQHLGLHKSSSENCETTLLLIPSLPKFKKLNHFLRDMGNRFLLRRIKTPFEFIHVHSFLAAPTAIYFKQKYGIPFLITEHSSLFFEKNIDAIDLKLAQNAFQESKCNIAVSDFLAQSLSERFNEKFSVIPNLISPLNSKKADENLVVLDSFQFVTVGNLVTEKNHLFMIKSFIKAFKGHEHICLKIVGDGYLKQELEQYIQQENVESQIELLGFKPRSEIEGILSHSDAYIMTSLFETFCIAIIEAMNVGLPVISTDFGGVISEIKHLPDVHIVAFKEDELSKKLVHLVNHNIRISPTNRNFILTHFSHQQFLDKLEFIYAA